MVTKYIQVLYKENTLLKLGSLKHMYIVNMPVGKHVKTHTDTHKKVKNQNKLVKFYFIVFQELTEREAARPTPGTRPWNWRRNSITTVT